MAPFNAEPLQVHPRERGDRRKWYDMRSTSTQKKVEGKGGGLAGGYCSNKYGDVVSLRAMSEARDEMSNGKPLLKLLKSQGAITAPGRWGVQYSTETGLTGKEGGD